jgi:hypothetical protein
LINGYSFKKIWNLAAGSISIPKITGKELYEKYLNSGGPGNISDEKMWEYHNSFKNKRWDFNEFVKNNRVDDVINEVFGTACYIEHGLPLALYTGYVNDGDLISSLKLNAEAGGDNVHRGMILGILLGSAQESIPDKWKKGLARYTELKNEINKFSEIAVQNTI